MLRREPDTVYYVYPSWAKLTYGWEALPGLLWNPLRSGYVDPRNVSRAGPFVSPHIDYYDGPEGGGIIAVELDPDDRWLGASVLRSEANLCSPPGIRPGPMLDSFGGRVFYIEPMRAMGTVEQFLRTPRVYCCSVTPEHASAAADRVYWLMVFEKGDRSLRGLDQMPGWAAAFSAELRVVREPPAELRSETESWVLNPLHATLWYQVSGGGECVGWQLAVALWNGLHLRRVAGKRLRSLHVVASIEGEPHFRPEWALR
jgi:hypothetical protein